MEVSGPPRERGRQHGRLAKVQIEASIGDYTRLLDRKYGQDWSKLAGRATDWADEIEAYDADLFEEAAGIAEGSERELGDIILLNARGEILYGNLGVAVPEGCTSFALLPEASGDGHVYCGQNWDFRLAALPACIILRVVQPPKPTVVTVVEAGQVGRHGVNSAGIGVFANGLGGFGRTGPGVPQPFIRRRMLDSSLINDALQACFLARQQIAANVLLVHRDGFAIDVETTPEGHAWLYPDDGVLVHGNHYEAFSWARDGDAYRPMGTDSLYRTWRTRHRLATRPADESPLDCIKSALSDHFGFPTSTCTHGDALVDSTDPWQTLASSIVNLTTGEWLFARGTPCNHEFTPLPWNTFDEEPSATSWSP